MAHGQLKGVIYWQLWNPQLFSISINNLWIDHIAQGEGALLFGNVHWLQIKSYSEVIHDKITIYCTTIVPRAFGRNCSYPVSWTPLQGTQLEKNEVPSIGSGTDFSPPCITTGVHEYQGTTIHTDDSGISHLLREETILGRLGKTQVMYIDYR